MINTTHNRYKQRKIWYTVSQAVCVINSIELKIMVICQIPFTDPFCHAGTNMTNSIMEDGGVIVSYTTSQNMTVNIIDIEQVRYHLLMTAHYSVKIVFLLSFSSILLYVVWKWDNACTDVTKCLYDHSSVVLELVLIVATRNINTKLTVVSAEKCFATPVRISFSISAYLKYRSYFLFDFNALTRLAFRMYCKALWAWRYFW